jgi:hypothetical protein
MSVSAEGWEKLRKGAELAFLDMSKAMEKALSKFKNRKNGRHGSRNTISDDSCRKIF